MSKKNIGEKYEYELSQKLGAGAFAEVYKGRNKLTGEVVAIKVIKRSLLDRYGEEMLQQIHREIKVLQDLVESMKVKLCPFINKIFDCLETANNIYIVLEFCGGGTLLKELKMRKKLPEDEAILIIYQLAQAMAFLQQNNIAHRDIKPENIFIKDGVYKLGDFGFAGQKQMYQTHLGTYPYMAPEFFNSKSYDGGVDIWALGCMFHEMLFGEIYFIGNSQYEVSQKILNKPYQLKEGQVCSPDVKDVLFKMIEKEKSKRITGIQLIEHPVFKKVKTSKEYLDIMDREEKYMQAYWGFQGLVNAQPIGDLINNDKQREEQLRLAKEEEERLKQLRIKEEEQRQEQLRIKQQEEQEQLKKAQQAELDRQRKAEEKRLIEEQQRKEQIELQRRQEIERQEMERQKAIQEQLELERILQFEKQQREIEEFQTRIRILELEEKQKEQQEKAKIQLLEKYKPQVTLIQAAINNMSNAILFYAQLFEFLCENFIEVCKFDMFYVLKNCVVKYNLIKEKLDAQQIFTNDDHVDFININPEAWELYYQNFDEIYSNQRDVVDLYQTEMLRSFYDILNFVNNQVSVNYKEYINEIQFVFNNDMSKLVQNNLIMAQFNSSIKHLQQFLSQVQDEGQKLKIRKAILWLFAGCQFEQVVQGCSFDTKAFIDSLDQNNFIAAKQVLMRI